MTMITCAVTLSLQRLVEFFLCAYLKTWASDRKNFKLTARKSSKDSLRSHRQPTSARSGKSTKSYSSSASSDGSTEASQRCEDEGCFSQDKVVSVSK